MGAPPSESLLHAVVVCTRNRPVDVLKLLVSLGEQECTHPFLVLIVDASDVDEATHVRSIVDKAWAFPVRYEPYTDAPSLARQRNHGVEALPTAIRIVHFLDDDVSLLPGYLETLTSILESRPEIGGVGGHVEPEIGHPQRGKLKRWISVLFLLETWTPGRVLPSGGQTGAQSESLTGPLEVQCLGGCASYRTELVKSLRFDDRLEGYSMDEDLDFSYRAGRVSRLMVEPKARLIHHVSQSEQHSVRASRRDLLVHRYWFLEKNLRHPLRKPAFWWKIFGSYLMASFSRNPDAREARRGIVDGVGIVLKRSHPLL